MLELPTREGRSGLGTTVVIVAPGLAPEASDGVDVTMEFLAEALVWNFWPRMVSTPGGERSTMTFHLTDQGQPVRLADPRTHERLRGFVEAMDRLRAEPHEGDDLVIDRPVDCLRPIRTLGRLVIQKGAVAPAVLPDRAVPEGARQTAASTHHVALMRNAELVVKYLRGAEPAGRFGYSGVFRCALDVDAAFRRSEPPTHDDWVYRFVPEDGYDRRFVKVALDRIARVCREAAGYDAALGSTSDGQSVPLGEFADALATLMPGLDGPGARRPAASRPRAGRGRRHAPGRSAAADAQAEVWVHDAGGTGGASGVADQGERVDGDSQGGDRADNANRPPRPPQTRAAGEPRPAITSDGVPVIRYPFELRGHGSRLRLAAEVEVMTNDGAQVELEAPRGYEAPRVRCWLDPAGTEHDDSEVVVGPDGIDGRWVVEVPIQDEAMMRVNVRAEVA
jgi:hypothetical protein